MSTLVPFAKLSASTFWTFGDGLPGSLGLLVPGLQPSWEANDRLNSDVERGKEAFTQSIVVRVPHRSHRPTHAGCPAALAELQRGVLRPLVGVMNDPLRATSPEGHVHVVFRILCKREQDLQRIQVWVVTVVGPVGKWEPPWAGSDVDEDAGFPFDGLWCHRWRNDPNPTDRILLSCRCS